VSGATKRNARLTCWGGLTGKRIVTAPVECLSDCSSQGSCDDAVAFWVVSNRLEWHATDDELRATLRECGAWDDLETADQLTLRSRALWTCAGDWKTGT